MPRKGYHTITVPDQLYFALEKIALEKQVSINKAIAEKLGV